MSSAQIGELPTLLHFDEAYARRILLHYALAGAIMTALSLLLYMVFGVCHVCALGWCERLTDWVCCRCCIRCAHCCHVPRAGRYTKATVQLLSLCMMLLWIPVIWGAAYGAEGNVRVGTSVSDAVGYIGDMIDTLHATANSSFHEVLKLDGPGRQELEAAFRSLNEGVIEVGGYYDDVQGSIVDANGIRGMILEAGFVSPLILISLTVVGAILPVAPTPYLGVIYSFTTAVQFFVWLSFTVHWPLVHVVRDACASVDAYLADPTGDSVLVSCLQRGTFLPSFHYVQDDLSDAMTRLADYVSPYINITGYLPEVDPTWEQSVDLYSEYAAQQLNRVTAELGRIPDTSLQRQVEENVRRAQTYLRVIAALARLAQCQAILDLFYRLKEDVCGPLVAGMEEVATADVVMGFLILPAAVLAILVFHHKPDCVRALEGVVSGWIHTHIADPMHDVIGALPPGTSPFVPGTETVKGSDRSAYRTPGSARGSTSSSSARRKWSRSPRSPMTPASPVHAGVESYRLRPYYDGLTAAAAQAQRTCERLQAKQRAEQRLMQANARHSLEMADMELSLNSGQPVPSSSSHPRPYIPHTGEKPITGGDPANGAATPAMELTPVIAIGPDATTSEASQSRSNGAATASGVDAVYARMPASASVSGPFSPGGTFGSDMPSMTRPVSVSHSHSGNAAGGPGGAGGAAGAAAAAVTTPSFNTPSAGHFGTPLTHTRANTPASTQSLPVTSPSVAYATVASPERALLPAGLLLPRAHSAGESESEARGTVVAGAAASLLPPGPLNARPGLVLPSLASLRAADASAVTVTAPPALSSRPPVFNLRPLSMDRLPKPKAIHVTAVPLTPVAPSPLPAGAHERFHFGLPSPRTAAAREAAAAAAADTPSSQVRIHISPLGPAPGVLMPHASPELLSQQMAVHTGVLPADVPPALGLNSPHPISIAGIPKVPHGAQFHRSGLSLTPNLPGSMMAGGASGSSGGDSGGGASGGGLGSRKFSPRALAAITAANAAPASAPAAATATPAPAAGSAAAAMPRISTSSTAALPGASMPAVASPIAGQLAVVPAGTATPPRPSTSTFELPPPTLPPDHPLGVALRGPPSPPQPPPS